jgi:serine/threonine protein kinase
MLATMRNGQKISIKFVYKHSDMMKTLNNKIKIYSECKEKAKSVEEKLKFQEKISIHEGSKKTIEDFLKNEKNIVNFKHKNCLKITWFGDFINHYVFLSEYSSNRDMSKFSKNFKKFLPINKNLKLPSFNLMSENLLRYFTTQILSAIEFFKNFRIVHGNLTLDNILITNNFQIKITDFACSKFMRSNELFSTKKNQNENSFDYLAPEFFRNDKFVEFRDAHKIDIFSLGCCLFMMATGRSLFEENKNNRSTENSYIEHIVKQVRKIPELLEEYTRKKWSPDFVKILQRMLEPFEKGRINIDELINSNWVRNNQRNLNKIESVYQSYPGKMITEMMKADHVSFYNNNCREKEDEFLKKKNLSIETKVLYNHIVIEKDNICMKKNLHFKNMKSCNKSNVKIKKIRMT